MTEADTTHDAPIETFADLPMQPTGSGVADLEVAYEQMRLAEDAEQTGAMSGEAAVVEETAVTESEAHPS